MEKSIDSSKSWFFETTELAGRKIQSRIALAPMTTYSSLPDGQIHPEEVPYYGRRAKAGYGLVITAACCVHKSGWSFDGQWLCDSHGMLDSLKLVAESINETGATSILQIHHGGRMAPSRLCGESVSASAIPTDRPGAETPRELTISEIETLVEAFGLAAELAFEAGFHGVEIHGANTYLLQQFVSPHSNRRTDEYGQDRLLFSKKIIERIISSNIQNFIVGYRFSPEELEVPGIRLAETHQLVNMLCETKLDYLHVSLRSFDQLSNFEPELGPITKILHNWIESRKPLMTSGGMKCLGDLQGAADLGADYFAIGRQAIIDPEFPSKIKNDEEIRAQYPKSGGDKVLTMPKTFDQKILNVSGWFDVSTK